MNIYDTYFNKSANDYCRNGGFESRAVLYRCIGAGNTAEIDRVFKNYIALLRPYLALDLVYAKQTTLYVFAQTQLVAVQNGVPELKAHGVQEAYYRAMDFADTTDEIIALLQEQCAELTKLVAASKKEQQYSELVKQCCEYIRDNLYEKLTVASVSAAVRFSASYVSHKFREETGETMEQYIRKMKVAEAKLLLRARLPLTQIASDLCFASQSHFTNTFKQETGLTPRQFSITNE